MTPILRPRGGRRLSCGCFCGRYQTADGASIETLDARDPECPHGHRVGTRLDPVAGVTPPGPAAIPRPHATGATAAAQTETDVAAWAIAGR
ncbi:MAG TPA: hypothetical protein VNE16_11525 [Vicinamibacterales bacterium]|nr:hypothetical protein [Vicinamibacterales bacterium]